MAIRKIAQLGEPVLRQRAREVSREELASPRMQTLIDDMVETMRDADGAGLAAPQVYESVAIVVIEVRNNPRYPQAETIPLMALVNPQVTPLVDADQPENAVFLYEGCLSVNGIRGRVRRPRRVRVRGWDRAGAELDFEWEGFRAVVVQHETDHLNGTLFVDRADPRTLTFSREYDRYVPLDARFVDGVRP
ncbi:MAG TPA: peptide deformylase [Polyangiaceae bacterium]|nr:peptide deformylase [Polyangiaceae bacterium]